jgi:hypothetical protein
MVALVIQPKGFSQFSYRAIVADHAQAFEQGGGLVAQAPERARVMMRARWAR